MTGKSAILDTSEGSDHDGYYEDDYLASMNGEDNGGIEGYEDDFKKAIDLLEQNHKRVPDSFLHIPSSQAHLKETDDELYLKKVNLYRSVATRNSMTRRSIDSDLDKLTSSLQNSKERWSSQTDVNDEYVDLAAPLLQQSPVPAAVPTQLQYPPASPAASPKSSKSNSIRTAHSSNSLPRDSCSRFSPKRLGRGSSTSLPLSRAHSSASLQDRRFNKSNTSVDSSTSLPEGWEKVDGREGAHYYWHIPSGTTQYKHPALSSNQDLSDKMGTLQISIPESRDDTLVETCYSPAHDDTRQLPPDQQRVLNLGYMDMDIKTMKGANSSVAINECIRKLSAVMHDPSQVDSLLQILTFEGTHLKLLDYSTGSVLSKQDILTIRRWGVGSDDVRNFAFVVKQKQANCYRCFVLHCYNPASQIALQMKNICQAAAEERDTQEQPTTMTEAALPSSVPDAVQAPARFDTLYLGYIRVEKEKGTDVIHAAIEKLESSNQTNWESVTMEINVSTINLIKTADRTLLAEHRVRFVSFMALGKHEHHLGYIVHGGPRIFYCHVYQSDSSCADMARAIQNACNARFQLLLAKQEENKKLQKPESPGLFSFLKRLKRKSPETERRSLATKG